MRPPFASLEIDIGDYTVITNQLVPWPAGHADYWPYTALAPGQRCLRFCIFQLFVVERVVWLVNGFFLHGVHSLVWVVSPDQRYNPHCHQPIWNFDREEKRNAVGSRCRVRGEPGALAKCR